MQKILAHRNNSSNNSKIVIIFLSVCSDPASDEVKGIFLFNNKITVSARGMQCPGMLYTVLGTSWGVAIVVLYVK